MNATRLNKREDICHIRKIGRTNQISDENAGRWPLPTFYRGRTPLWTDAEVERGLREEIERLSAESIGKRGDIQVDMAKRLRNRNKDIQPAAAQ